jgi:molecular chaperone GrpE
LEQLLNEEAAVAEDTAEAAASHESEPLSVEELVVSLESVSGERDRYLDSLRRVQAEFENYKKAVAKRTADERERANDKIVNDLLPVLDACDGAVKNGIEDVVPVQNQLLAALQRHGLEVSDPAEAPFDPEQHEAVMHEPSDDVDQPTVAEVLRTGYLWKGRTLRPAMVRVKG